MNRNTKFDFLISHYTFNLKSTDKYNWINLFTKSGDLTFFYISAPHIKHDMFLVYMWVFFNQRLLENYK